MLIGVFSWRYLPAASATSAANTEDAKSPTGNGEEETETDPDKQGAGENHVDDVDPDLNQGVDDAGDSGKDYFECGVECYHVESSVMMLF